MAELVSELMYGIAASGKIGSFVAVNIDGQVVQAVAGRDITYVSGDPIMVHRKGSRYFAGVRLYANIASPPTDTDIPPNPQLPVTTGSLIVSPVETRSYRTSFSVGWRTDDDDVYHGQYGGYGNHIGSVFYGGKPKSLSGSTVTGAKIRIRNEQIGAYPPTATTMRLMTEASRPSGAPTLTSTTTGPVMNMGSTNDAFVIPTAWAQSLVDGTAGGIAFYNASGSPYVRYAGRGKWSPAFTLTIDWRR